LTLLKPLSNTSTTTSATMPKMTALIAISSAQ
jgi:hypothetical protein